ncbi:MAG: hypothetical protein J0I95_11770 [Microbacterium sp.]|uniref:glycosyltransferase n=1 Tax=unclassified Microbacterium TaxID=2609290 RepID=UPI000A65FB84|nr:MULTISPECIES: glycosyltransferase [unclassified Microbacterium]MBN9212176.1 hypothetical protein [Microbacterium sp.]
MIDISTAFAKPRPRLLLVASNGGHLEQLHRLSEGSDIDPDSQWVTFDTPQAHGLLDPDRTHYVPPVEQRDALGAVRAVPGLRRILASGKFDGVVSTGAAIAAPAFVAARSMGLPTLYIESVSRVEGPSVTGRLVYGSRLASTVWTQHEAWRSGRWQYHGSVLDRFESVPVETPDVVPSLFVTLGTLRRYPFPRPVERLVEIGAVDDRTIWQLGVTPAPDGLPGEVNDFFSSARFDAAARSAGVVVSHAGVGSVLRLIEMGVYPLLVVRRSARGEHIDDHQAQIARLLELRNLAIVREADEITLDDLHAASARKVRPL